MPAGTIALTNNSATVTGTGTAFNSELKANDFLVVVAGGVTYTLGVKSVESATGLTLTTNYTGPTMSGLAWTGVPNATLVGITAQVAADVARAIRGLNADKANWQQVFSEDANITVRLPDGSEFTGPSWLKVVEMLKDIDLEGLQVIAGEIDADAQQVAADKVTASNAAQTATDAAATATQKALEADTSAANAESSETSAADSATSAGASATTATEQADRAQTEADRAEQAANQAGGVKTVNGVSPDDGGHITVRASDILFDDESSIEAKVGDITRDGDGNIVTPKGIIISTEADVVSGSKAAATAGQLYDSTSALSKQMASAWVSFTVDPATFAVTISDSFNVSSVSRSTGGVYFINFTRRMNNANYSHVITLRSPNTVVGAYSGFYRVNDLKTVSQCVVVASYATANSTGLFDPAEMNVIIMGGV
ncbi:hypothetical protein [[Erwinia] mediterraneensis]|uniref:hypothetical protein n=1 Tax=[Erwinia] mediterraneensis TaxID=2161819 RepID=UPI001F3A7C9A|nr:hypothetical protein [[Erwinia] mediterraneensis]